jgi:hypothetical protein
VAATPSVVLSPLVLGEWQRRAELSTLLLPSQRMTFCAV